METLLNGCIDITDKCAIIKRLVNIGFIDKNSPELKSLLDRVLAKTDNKMSVIKAGATQTALQISFPKIAHLYSVEGAAAEPEASASASAEALK